MQVFEGCPTPNARFCENAHRKSKNFSSKLSLKMSPKSIHFSLYFSVIFGGSIFEDVFTQGLHVWGMSHTKRLFAYSAFYGFFWIFMIFWVPKSSQKRITISVENRHPKKCQKVHTGLDVLWCGNLPYWVGVTISNEEEDILEKTS